jgi:hypothetical protein
VDLFRGGRGWWFRWRRRRVGLECEEVQVGLWPFLLKVDLFKVCLERFLRFVEFNFLRQFAYAG